jgi:hypothetical protein
LAALCVQASAIAQEKPAAPAAAPAAESKLDFAAVTDRGRALYAYDQAAWHGTDAIFALKPDVKGLAHYICTQTAAGWVVIFPKWNEAHDQLLAVYEATETKGRFVARKLDTATPADAGLVAKERALELALADFPAPTRPFNTAILPAPGGNYYVYVYPGQTKEDVWPIGGDVRYTISGDGKTLMEKRKLHNAILDMQVKSKQVGGYHTHAISDVPEDTDVFYVLNRKPSMPEFVGTSKQLFVIDKDGNIEIGK